MAKQFLVYILKCDDQSYYVGVTSNLNRRIKEHHSRKNPSSYTATRLPIELIFTRNFNRARAAIAFEKQVKGWSRKKKEALAMGDIQSLKTLSQCRNLSHSALKYNMDSKKNPSS